MARVLADDVSINYNGTNHYLNFVNAAVYDAGGNNNNRLDPGETANLTSILRNIGGANFSNLQTTIQSTSPYVTISDNSGYFGNLLIDSIKENLSDPYTVTIGANCPQGQTIIFRIIAADGAFADTYSFTKVVGSYHYLVWNPDPIPNSGQSINATLNTLGYSGNVVTNLATEPTLDVYRAIFICVGIYPNNYRIIANGPEANAIINYLNAGGKVYMEGGDVWYYDPLVGGHSFGPLFGLTGTADGTGDMGPVVGQALTFTSDMNFNYSGENGYMDHLNPTTGMTIFRDGNNGYNCGISYVATNYRTVGTSFELGGLVDGSGVSTKAILLDSIMHFFGIFTVGIEEENANPNLIINDFSTYPNPVKIGNPIRFQFTSLQNSNIKLRIYNTLGTCVKTLPVNKPYGKTTIWNGDDQYLRKLPAGVYFANLEIDNTNKYTARIVLID